MATVIYTEEFKEDIHKKFKGESVKIFSMLITLEENPKKGKQVGLIGNIAIKEIKYKSFRFYFITDNFKIKFLKIEELQDLILKFVRMSDKKHQEKVIEEIKEILRRISGMPEIKISEH